jgi:hypothetical protein
MGTYRIVCVTTVHPHRHLVTVGIGSSAASPTERITVTAARNRIDNGDTFYTQSPTGVVANVRKDDCNIDGCDVKTLRSTADATTENNLDNLAICP